MPLHVKCFMGDDGPGGAHIAPLLCKNLGHCHHCERRVHYLIRLGLLLALLRLGVRFNHSLSPVTPNKRYKSDEFYSMLHTHHDWVI
eukprot:COSAG02_NODE_4203_length_5629_cov_3.527667_5_plen_87_part_00